jgi:hypothetical protein
MALGNSRNQHDWFTGALSLGQPTFPGTMPSDFFGFSYNLWSLSLRIGKEGHRQKGAD